MVYLQPACYNFGIAITCFQALSLVIAFLLGSIFIPIRSNYRFSEAEITRCVLRCALSSTQLVLHIQYSNTTFSVIICSMLSTIFIAFIIIGVLSMTSVLPVMLSIRDMYYRHRAAGMLSSRSVGRALASAEKRFILISSALFCAVFLPTSGIVNSPLHSLWDRVKEGFAFWGFFTFNAAIYSYTGKLAGGLEIH